MQAKIPPPLLLLIAGGLMYSIRQFSPSTPLGELLLFQFNGQKELASALFALGAVIAIYALYLFHQAKTTHDPIKIDKASSLVTTGIYRFTRNPMYLGILLILIGWGIKLGSLLALLIIPLFIWSITSLQIKPEERVLLENFGDAYSAYCKKVRRWV